MGAQERVVFVVRGLACASCAIDVGQALRKMQGVVEININYEADRGYVEFDPRRASWDAIAKAISDRGYVVVRSSS